MASSRLPGSVTAAAVLLLIFGTLAALGTALMVFVMALFSAIPYSFYQDPTSVHLDPICQYATAGIPCHYPMIGEWTANIGAFWWIGMTSIAGMALIGAVVAGGHVAAGVAILRQRTWGRILGMVVGGTAVIVVVLGLGSMLTAAVPILQALKDAGLPNALCYGCGLGAQYASTMMPTIAFSAIMAVGFGVAYGYVIWALARHEEAFE